MLDLLWDGIEAKKKSVEEADDDMMKSIGDVGKAAEGAQAEASGLVSAYDQKEDTDEET